MSDSAGGSSSKGNKLYGYIAIGVSVLFLIFASLLTYGFFTDINPQAEGDELTFIIRLIYWSGGILATEVKSFAYIGVMVGWWLLGLLVLGFGILQLRGD